MGSEVSDDKDGAEGLLFGCLLDGKGGARTIGWDEVERWQEADGPLWVHLDGSASHVRTWLLERSGLSRPTVSALLASETRPRVFRGRRGTVAMLRGVNLNPGAEPEDMVAMHMWCDGHKLITLRYHRLMTPRDILAQLIKVGDGPRDVAELFERLIARLTERMATTVEAYDARLDQIEMELDITRVIELRRSLSNLRLDIVGLRRFMSPQREALYNIMMEPPAWLDENSRMNMRETTDRLVRYIEELDAVRDRSLVIKDDIANELAESTNRTLYNLAIISVIFLPLTFLTGLFGINIGGIPGDQSGNAFWIFCVVMALLFVLEVLVIRHLDWQKMNGGPTRKTPGGAE